MKVTELYYLTENLRYILLSEQMYFPAISPFLSDWVTFTKAWACQAGVMSVRNFTWKLAKVLQIFI